MRKVESYGNVTNGLLRISHRSKFIDLVSQFPDCRVMITVEKLYKKRSTSTIKEDGTSGRGQNGYYFTIVVNSYKLGAWEMQGRDISLNDAHGELKANCNYIEKYKEDTGEIMRAVRSTANLNTVEFEEYLERCREFIREWFGIDCPLPNEQSELIFK